MTALTLALLILGGFFCWILTAIIPQIK